MDMHFGSDLVSLSIDEEGVLTGISSTGILAGPVRISIGERHWATVSSRPAEGSAGRSFRCDLPSAQLGSDGFEEVSVTDLYGDPLASIRVPPRRGRTNAAGVPAKLVLGLCDRPFFAVPYWTFDGAVLTIVGSHLPPAGDPSALSVEFGPGVAYEFRYPLDSPGFAGHFWYWPNAGLSDFQLVIDLAASMPGSDPFSFRFKYAKGPQADFAEPYGRVWIPRDLYSVVGLPRDATQLTRVQTWSDTRSVTLTGFNHYCVIQALLARHGVRPYRGIVLLDWGCGHGRVTRHFVREWTGANVIGMDVDGENIAWASENLAPGRFVHSPLMPPCPLDDNSVDAVFSISVMTHLPLDVQLAWLADLARVVRPGGIVLMSFGGPGAVAWSSVWNAPSYFEAWSRDGIHADQVDPAMNGKIDDPSYYRNVAQTHEHIAREWAEHFDILEILSEAIGTLDFAVLRRR